MGLVEGKVIAVTGAGRGIGRAVALDPEAPDDYRQLAAWLVEGWRSSPPRGIGGKRAPFENPCFR